MKKNNRLDEMQEQKLLRIEHNGFWLAFWALAAVICIQLIFSGPENVREVAGETVVLFLISLYVVFACIRNGIWDRKLAPNPKTNLVVSLIGGAAAGAVLFLITFKNYHNIYGSAATFVFVFVITFILCYLALCVCVRMYQKKVNELEKEDEDEM